MTEEPGNLLGIIRRWNRNEVPPIKATALNRNVRRLAQGLICRQRLLAKVTIMRGVVRAWPVFM
jgi:stage V sporulation protein SpoVS